MKSTNITALKLGLNRESQEKVKESDKIKNIKK